MPEQLKDEGAPVVCSVWGPRETSAFDRAVIQHTMNAVVACDVYGNLVMFNPTAREWHGLDARQMAPELWVEHYRLFLPDGVTPFPADEVPLIRALAGETVRNVEMVICAKGQPLRNVSCSGGPFCDADGHKLGAFVVMVDTTERDTALTALRESEAMLARSLMEAPFPAVVHADDGEVIQINKVWEQSIGYAQIEVPTVGVLVNKVFKAEASGPTAADSGHDGVFDGEQTITTASGDCRIWDFSSTPLGKLADGRRVTLSMARDVTELRRLAIELQHLATHDPLTGLPNRRLFEAETKRAAAFAERGTMSTILFADVDRFKSCNDQFGHEFGDKVLHEIAQGMKHAVRTVDTVARIGGDEFGVVLWGQSGAEIERISRRLAGVVASIGRSHGLDIGLSIGAATLNSDEDASAVLAHADTRMYEAKASEQTPAGR